MQFAIHYLINGRTQENVYFQAGTWKHINKLTKKNNYKFSISSHQTYVKFLTMGFFIHFTFYKRVSLENFHLDNFWIYAIKIFFAVHLGSLNHICYCVMC